MAKINFGLYGYQFKTDNNWLSYKSIYGKNFRVLLKDIESVSVDTAGLGKGKLKINGKGTTLAEVELPMTWAGKAQEFILKETGQLE